jgi:hypothetical protein
MMTIIPRFAFRLNKDDAGEISFEFDRLQEIFSTMSVESFEKMSPSERIAFAHDAVVTALAGRVAAHQKLPQGDDDRVVCDGYVELEVEEAMKMVLHEVCRTQFNTIAALAKRLGKSETAARRLLDFRHKSRPAEINSALNLLGKNLHHVWHLTSAA